MDVNSSLLLKGSMSSSAFLLNENVGLQGERSQMSSAFMPE